MKKPVILVTGSGGFIGGWIAEALHLAKYGHVKAGISRWASAARIARFPVEIVQCDIMSETSLDAALKGVDIVVHCARGKGNDNSVTTGGTRMLIERIKAAGVQKLIFTSSVAVYGEATGIVREDTPPVAPITEYGQGKRDAEAICEQYADDRLAISVIRPTLVYGPFSDLWTTPYLTRFASGKWSALGDRGEGKCNLVYVGDIVRFVQFLIDHDVGPYAVFNANGPEVPTWNSYLERFNLALGHPPLKAPDRNLGVKVMMRRPVRMFGKYMLANHRDLLLSAANRSPQLKSLMKKTEEDLRLKPSDDDMQRFSMDVTYSMEKAAAAGFVPKTSVDDGIAMTVDWARSSGLAA
ncbi:MAG: NAD(P)-dependent oxidoreductase [Mesorhizobium sp.]|nr:NAD(P)-dependent oxidoreductase [Mesorhizobium sp.]MBL8580518.1 NAD(P)-dependent oxidoreductase [Mesorhizobium sp.]